MEMEYFLTVTKKEPNPKWVPQSRLNDQYYRGQEEPELLVHKIILEVSLKEEEFVAIKKQLSKLLNNAFNNRCSI
jgi:hypothetical protein